MSYLGKKFTLKNVSEILLDSEKKLLRGGSTNYVCWHRCTTMGFPTQPTASVWGTCYDAYQECTSKGWLTSCGCNG